MEKYCNKCDTTKPVSEFHKNASSKDGLTLYCRQCNIWATKERYEKDPDYYKEWKENNPDYHKEWNQKNPDKLKEYVKRSRPRRIERTYGITIEYYNDLLDQQNNCCAICREENKNGKSLSVDHDHSCCKGKNSCGECVRQLLCNSCNSMIGFARDNIEILKEAQNYLERHSRSKISEEILD